MLFTDDADVGSIGCFLPRKVGPAASGSSGYLLASAPQNSMKKTRCQVVIYKNHDFCYARPGLRWFVGFVGRVPGGSKYLLRRYDWSLGQFFPKRGSEVTRSGPPRFPLALKGRRNHVLVFTGAVYSS